MKEKIVVKCKKSADPYFTEGKYYLLTEKGIRDDEWFLWDDFIKSTPGSCKPLIDRLNQGSEYDNCEVSEYELASVANNYREVVVCTNAAFGPFEIGDVFLLTDNYLMGKDGIAWNYYIEDGKITGDPLADLNRWHKYINPFNENDFPSTVFKLYEEECEK